MSLIQLSENNTDLQQNTCPHCGAILPDDASFCNKCGERLDSSKSLTTLLEQEEDIATRYRITSLVRRRPFVNLYFASDFTQTASQGQSRMVAIRDVDLTSLDDAVLISAVKLAQQEYDLLRRIDIPHLMPAIDLRYSQRHLYLVANQPAAASSSTDLPAGSGSAKLVTLQDYLQSGQGLPSEQGALRWIAQLCEAIDGLHQLHIVLGDLDPFAVLYSGALNNPGAANLSLLISWLSPELRSFLPVSSLPATGFISYFVAPEVAQGTVDIRSDVYSLGAILYLLLTGLPPGESTQRFRSRQGVLRAPHEINGQINSRVSECVMQALALQPAERFDSAGAFVAALRDPRYRRPAHSPEQDTALDESGNAETIRIFPLSWKDVERWRAAHRRSTHPLVQQMEQAPDKPAEQSSPVQAAAPASPVMPPQPIIPPRPVTPRPSLLVEADVVEEDLLASRSRPLSSTPAGVPETPPVSEDVVEANRPSRQSRMSSPGWVQRISGFLPAISTRQSINAQGRVSWLDRLKQVLLGQPQQVITAAAIVETPLRVLPDQMYTLRIHVVGRNQPGRAAQRRSKGGEISLSSLVSGDTVQIEVRSVLQQNYAYILQRASVAIPAEGYVAEVTIPMQPLSNAPSGRRDRLHIYFMNEHREQLYEKPFAIEIFVSHHVKPGNEGHNVLTIPL